MATSTYIPDELYYLDPGPAKRMTKVQMKLVLTKHNVEFDKKSNREELVALFNKEIASNSEEILRKYYENQEQKVEIGNIPQRDQFGRGKRTSQRPSRYENDVQVTKRKNKTKATDKRRTDTRNTVKKDEQGFVIPQTPLKQPAVFTAEDSFDEDSDDSEDEDFHSNTNSRRSVQTKLPSPAPAPVHITPTPRRREPKQQPTFNDEPPSFNAEDSFASTDENEYKKPIKTRVVRSKHTTTITKNDISSLDTQETIIRAINNELEQAEKAKEPLVDDVDLDYQADSDESDDEEEVENVDEGELSLLRGDQDVPVEKLMQFNPAPTNNIKAFNILNSSILVYLASILVVITIYMVTRQEPTP